MHSIDTVVVSRKFAGAGAPAFMQDDVFFWSV